MVAVQAIAAGPNFLRVWWRIVGLRKASGLAFLSERAGFVQFVFHSSPTLTRRFFRSACAAPVSFQANGVVIAVELERGELANPINRACTHGGPGWFFFGIGDFCDVLTVAMTDAIFRQEIVCARVRSFATPCGVAGIPIEHERR